MKCSDEIFSGAQIDAGFSADRTVHLGHDGGGNLNDWNAPIIDGRGESRQIANHSTSQSHARSFAGLLHGGRSPRTAPPPLRMISKLSRIDQMDGNFESFLGQSVRHSVAVEVADFPSLTIARRPFNRAPRQIRPASSRRFSPIWTG